MEKHGSKHLNLLQILMPAIKLAEDGFEVGKITQNAWKSGAKHLLEPRNVHGCDLLVKGFSQLNHCKQFYVLNLCILLI